MRRPRTPEPKRAPSWPDHAPRARAERPAKDLKPRPKASPAKPAAKAHAEPEALPDAANVAKRPTTPQRSEPSPERIPPPASVEAAPAPFVPLLRTQGAALKNKRKKAPLTPKEALAVKVKANAARHPPRSARGPLGLHPSRASGASARESSEELEDTTAPRAAEADASEEPSPRFAPAASPKDEDAPARAKPGLLDRILGVFRRR
jgi:hypothetical protein